MCLPYLFGPLLWHFSQHSAWFSQACPPYHRLTAPINFATCCFRWIHYFFNIIFNEFKCIWHQLQKELKGIQWKTPLHLIPSSCLGASTFVIFFWIPPEMCIWKQVNVNKYYYMNSNSIALFPYLPYNTSWRAWIIITQISASFWLMAAYCSVWIVIIY